MRRAAVSHLRPDPAEDAAASRPISCNRLVIGVEHVLDAAKQFQIVAQAEGCPHIEQLVSFEANGVGGIIPACTDKAQIRPEAETEIADPVAVNGAEMLGSPRQIEIGRTIFRIDIGIYAGKAKTGCKIEACFRFDALRAGAGGVQVHAGRSFRRNAEPDQIVAVAAEARQREVQT